MTYRESLPEGCPPPEAEHICGPRIVFRLTRTCPPTDDDFRSQRAEKPDNRFNLSECQDRGLSVFLQRRDAERKLRIRHLRGMLICPIILTEGAGRIQNTGRTSHHTWWPLSSFDILKHCQIL